MIEHTELSVFRPAWTQRKLQAGGDLLWHGIIEGYFDKTQGMPGKIGRVIERRRRNRYNP